MKTLQVTDLEKCMFTLAWLHKHCFPNDDQPDWAACSWWITWDEGLPVAFIGVQPVDSWERTIYISRVGVREEYRGRRIQSFLMDKVLKAAKSAGYDRVISSTYNNPSSANNFIHLKFKTYMPQTPWGADGTIYWVKEL